jgi:hypothetical protein
MQKPIRTALLVGSWRGPNSVSNSLGTFLLERLQHNGLTTEKIFISQSLGSDEKRATMLRVVDESDLIILAFPLYGDSPSSRVIQTLEVIAENQKNRPNGKKSFVAIANCGFPEAKHNNTALAGCKIFAKQVGFKWAGSLAVGGMEGFLKGHAPGELGFTVRNQKKAIEIAADALSRGEPIPEKAVVLMSKLAIPGWLFLWFSKRLWRNLAKKGNIMDKIYDQPFKKDL